MDTRPSSEQMEELTPKEADEVETLGAVVEEEDAYAEPGNMKIDLHCHSEASADCSTPLEMFPARCRERGVWVQAITDHNEIWGAQKLQEMVEEEKIKKAGFPLTIIVGEEVSTTHGEIIGLFLKEKIPAGMSPKETVAAIKEQGGLVSLPHGFDPLKRWRLQPTALETVADQIDVVETFNARISQLRWNQAAVDWAKVHEVPMSAGSDAHTLADIGGAWVEVPVQRIQSPQDLLSALQSGVPVGEWTHPVVAFAYKVWDRSLRRLRVRM
ncbi:MAG TPA: PHP-associated domain-containing protein [Anaerolineales bacterium]|nr:PHP-associated domain-containing protein [Anaerolineales bacterium]